MAVNIEKIQLKRAAARDTVVNAPMFEGEPAIAFNERELWVGTGTGKIKISDVVVVPNQSSLPVTPEAEKLYLVLDDATVGNEPSLYAHVGGSYTLITGGVSNLTSSDITDFSDAVDTVITNDWRGQNDGLAPLDSGGQIPSTFLPPINVTDVHVVETTGERDGLTVQQGDIALVGIPPAPYVSYIYTGTEWLELTTGPDGVLTVNGISGPTVLLTTTEISEGSNLYFTNARAIAALILDSAGNGVVDKTWSADKLVDQFLAERDYLGTKSINEGSIADGKSVVYNATSQELEYHAITIDGGDLDNP